MSLDFNSELHARPSIYFEGPAFVEHVAFMPAASNARADIIDHVSKITEDASFKTQVEHHTEFVTVTRVYPVDNTDGDCPVSTSTTEDYAQIAGLADAHLVCRVGILVTGPAPDELGTVLRRFEFGDTAASSIGDGAAQVCSDFRVHDDQGSRIILFNKDLNAYRLGRMVRRIYEIETYRAMALLGLPEARRLSPRLMDFDAKLVQLTSRNLNTSTSQHKPLLDEISALSAEIISATAETRTRFGATAAYAKIVEERITELREQHVAGFQRFGVFVARRFNPAVRTCHATAVRLEQLSHATMHLIDLLQTRIQVEIEYQNAVQIQAMADRAATQVKIQRAVEGFSIIAISYYLLSLLKTVFETLEHSGYHLSPLVMLVSIPVVIVAVCVTILRVKHALKHEA